MAIFTNQASLTYNGVTTNSNLITGERREALTATLRAVHPVYAPGGGVAFVIHISNNGENALEATVAHDLGAYALGEGTMVPLTYLKDSAQLFVGGEQKRAPDVLSTRPLRFGGVLLPAGQSATLIFQTFANRLAPLSMGGGILSRVEVASQDQTASAEEIVTVRAAAALTVMKSLCPERVPQNGRLTYTFMIQNTGNAAAVAVDSVVLNDTFNPALKDISASFDGEPWREGEHFTYDEKSGEFLTAPGKINVPAARYAQDAQTGAWVVAPGVSTLVVTGTL